MNDPTLALPGLSSVGGKPVVARFDGGMLSCDSGVLALAAVGKRLHVADRRARCIDDPRCPGHQDCRAGGRDENPDPPALADILPRSAHPAHRPGSHPRLVT